MSLLVATGLSKAFGALDVFSGVDLRIEAGDRIGFVGANGAGKTTLLRILAGVEESTAGDVARKRGLTVGLSAPGPTARGRRDPPCRHARGLRPAAGPGRRAARDGTPAGRCRERVSTAITTRCWRSTATRRPLSRWLAATTTRRASARCWAGWASTKMSTTSRWRTSAVVNARARSWPSFCCRSRTCCCWTSRPTTWTWRRSSGWRRPCCTGRVRLSSSRTIATSWTRSPTASGT